MHSVVSIFTVRNVSRYQGRWVGVAILVVYEERRESIWGHMGTYGVAEPCATLSPTSTPPPQLGRRAQ